MANEIYADIARRTNGDIYVGVVGPVRSGKSTFIKRFMEQLVIPNIQSEARRERAVDELPQSAGGKTIMTTEPKFIPEDAVEITPEEGARLRVRLIDCVGYIVPSSLGYVEGDHALQVISATLKEVCSASGGFIARYGGDEFVVLQKAAAEQDIIDLCSAINDELARAEVPYLLRMSIGYARVGDGVDTWQGLLRAADAELYRVKAEKKKAGVQIR